MRRIDMARTKTLHKLLLVVPVALLGLLGCDRAGEDRQSKQTGFPGQVSAGGGTSGEVMARAGGTTAMPAPSGTPGIPQGAGGTTGGAASAQAPSAGGGAPHEGTRGQSTAGTGSSGTPGIPEGSGGTTSGAAMGGTSSGAAASQAAPPPGGAQPSIPAQQEKR
jgi:hypothetical protein